MTPHRGERKGASTENLVLRQEVRLVFPKEGGGDDSPRRQRVWSVLDMLQLLQESERHGHFSFVDFCLRLQRPVSEMELKSYFYPMLYEEFLFWYMTYQCSYIFLRLLPLYQDKWSVLK